TEPREGETSVVDGGEAVGSGQIGAVIGHGEIVEGHGRFWRLDCDDGGCALGEVRQHVQARLVTCVHSRTKGGNQLNQLLAVDSLPFLPAMQPDLSLSDEHRMAVNRSSVRYNADTLQDIFDRREWDRQTSRRGVLVAAASRRQSIRLERIVEVGRDQGAEIV